MIDGDIVRGPRNHVYWSYNPSMVHFQINEQHAIELLRKAVFEYDELMLKFFTNMKTIAEKFTWTKAAEQIISLAG